MKTSEHLGKRIIRSLIVLGITMVATRLLDKGLNKLEIIIKKRLKTHR